MNTLVQMTKFNHQEEIDKTILQKYEKKNIAERRLRKWFLVLTRMEYEIGNLRNASEKKTQKKLILNNTLQLESWSR